MGVVASYDQQALLEVLLTQIDGLFEHPLDFVVRQPVTGLDVDRMLAARALIARRYI